jgi:hypothetical protein
VGLGRSYVKLAGGRVDFDRWVDGIAAGRAYVTDGKSHLFDFTVGGREMGTGGSELRLAAPGTVDVKLAVAARLDETPKPDIGKRPYTEKPYWELERARIGAGREVPVELVVNGQVVATRNVLGDGQTRDVVFTAVKIERSSWVAARILPSSHTNPVFVLVAGQPIRASRRSVEWASKTVDACWQQKRATYKPAEQEPARAAYDHARGVYRRILAETTVD